MPDTPLVINDKGRAYTGNGFRASFFKVIRKLVETGKVDPGLTFHGLRVPLATRVADAGADTRDIAALLGHATESMAAHYARHAETGRRAARAVALTEQRGNGTLDNIRADLENVSDENKKAPGKRNVSKGLNGSGGGT